MKTPPVSGAGTRITTTVFSGLLSLMMLMSACDGRTSSPTRATPVPTPPLTPAPTAPVTYVLSGVVFEIIEAGRVPVEGVEVYCDSCGSPTGHTSVHTDAAGAYSLSWAANGAHPLLVTKTGYQLPDPTGRFLGMITATVNGDTRFDIQLVRR